MIRILPSAKMGKSEMGWLHSTFHFSFAEYHNPQNMQFGALRVVNDDIFDPKGGFDTHPHQNMEIISYVVRGVLTHADSLGNQRQLTRGQVQYMSAGTGITHSEFNHSPEPLRFLQIWIYPDKNGHAPQYGDHQFPWEARQGKWLCIASGRPTASPVCIHQDVEVLALCLDAGQVQSYSLAPGRMGYLIQIEGQGNINTQPLAEKDAAEITGESITLQAVTNSHYILFDLAPIQ